MGERHVTDSARRLVAGKGRGTHDGDLLVRGAKDGWRHRLGSNHDAVASQSDAHFQSQYGLAICDAGRWHCPSRARGGGSGASCYHGCYYSCRNNAGTCHTSCCSARSHDGCRACGPGIAGPVLVDWCHHASVFWELCRPLGLYRSRCSPPARKAMTAFFVSIVCVCLVCCCDTQKVSSSELALAQSPL